MAKTIANVLVGVASLFIRQPNDAKAEWSTVQKYAGNHSAKLYKGNSGNAGSTHLQITPPTRQTLTDFVLDPTDYSFRYWYSAVTGNFIQFELRFEDPDSDAWVEVTVVPHQNTLGIASWLQKALASGDACGIGGVGEEGESFFDWDLGSTITTLITDIDAQSGVTSCGDWTLRRVRLELWEAEPERTVYLDSVELDGVVYTIEPGGTAPAMQLDSGMTEVGYSEEGVTWEYTAEVEPTRVEEETFPIGAALTSEEVTISMNLAESSLYNLHKALSGAALSGSILTLGGGVLKTMNIRISITNPAGYTRHLLVPSCYTDGAVAVVSRRNAKSVIPITFHALKTTDEPAMTLVENAA